MCCIQLKGNDIALPDGPSATCPPAAIENYKVLKTEAQKSGEAVLKIAAEAATTGKKGKGKGVAAASKAGGGSGPSSAATAGGPSRADAPDDPIKRELDAEIEKLRGLLVGSEEKRRAGTCQGGGLACDTWGGGQVYEFLTDGPVSFQVVPPSSLVPPPPTQQGSSSPASSALSSLRGKVTTAKGSPDSKAAASAGKLVDDIRGVTRESNKRLNKDYMVREQRLGLTGQASLLRRQILQSWLAGCGHPIICMVHGLVHKRVPLRLALLLCMVPAAESPLPCLVIVSHRISLAGPA